MGGCATSRSESPVDRRRRFADRFAAWLTAAVETYLANYELHDVVFHEFRPGNRNPNDKEVVIAQLSALLAEGVEARAWTLPDVRAAALLIFDGMHGVVDDAIYADEHDVDAICRRLSVLFGRVLSS